jgi:Flp pilus assembly protein TadD
MSIVLSKDLLQLLFPSVADSATDSDKVESILKDYYERGPVSVAVEANSAEVQVEITQIAQSFSDSRLGEASAAGDSGNFRKAERLLKPIREQYPWESDVHRMYAQSLFEQGRSDEATEPALDAIRWDPENVYALILAGNIYLRGQNDTTTAKRLYDHAAALAPDDHLVLNNIGGALLKEGKREQAKQYLEMALEANAGYPRTHYGLALAEQEGGKPKAAFQHIVSAFKADSRGKLREPLLKAAQSIARDYRTSERLDQVAEHYRAKVAERSTKDVRMEERDGLSEAAKLEVAENHGRSFHNVVSKPGARHRTHLVMHELVHLDFICEAREVDQNELFLHTDKTRAAFNRDHSNLSNDLSEQGLADDQINRFIDSIYQGILGHIYNAPVDLFIEQKLHDEFPELRPAQFDSLIALMQSYVKSATDKQVQSLTPEGIYRANTVLNLTHAIHLRDLYGVDFTYDFRASRRARKLAEKLYEDFLEIKDDRLPGEEYELVEDWGHKLGLLDYFQLEKEDPSRYRGVESSQEDAPEERGTKGPEEVMDEVRDDPHNLEDPNRPDGEGAQVSFDDGGAGSMAVTMHLADAINFYRDRNQSEIQGVAFEIAMLGTQGIDPSKTEKRYTLNSVPGRKFSPLQLLAYMFAGFKELDESVDTQLDFEEQYEDALEIANLDR